MSSVKLNQVRDRLRLPLIAAPMFLVSGPDLVVAAGKAGIVGSFPTANCRSAEQLDGWVAIFRAALPSMSRRRGGSRRPIVRT